MARIGQAFFDNKGASYATPDLATIADIAAIVGRKNGPEGLGEGVARLIFDKRQEIEQAFADHDVMLNGGVTPLLRDSHLLNSATAGR
jgi:hypothetical protein